MKKIFLWLFIFSIALFAISCNNKKGYAITGHITGYKDGTKVKLVPYENQNSEQYTTIENNTFVFEGTVVDIAERFHLAIDNGKDKGADGFTMFIGNENVEITFDKNDFSKFNITGSKHQDVLNKAYKQLVVYWPESRRLTDEYMMLKKNAVNKDSITEIYRGENGKLTKFEKISDSIYKNFIRENYNSYPALQQLIFDKDNFDHQEIISIYNKLSPEYKNSRFGKAIKSFIDRPQLKEGDMAYDFDAVDSHNKKHNLQEYLNKGKLVLLEFTSPKCGHCKKAIPFLTEISKEKKEKLEIVSLTIIDKESWKKANEKEKMTYTRLFTVENGWLGKTVIGYDVNATPTFFLLSPDGKIIKKISGNDSRLKEEIYSLLQ